MNYFWIFIGGGAGSVCRFAIAKWMSGKQMSQFPVATLTVNLLSSFILGVLIALLIGKSNKENLWLLLAVGFCGGLSTFSAFSMDLFNLVRSGMIVTALLNILLSVILCTVALWFGYFLCNR